MDSSSPPSVGFYNFLGWLEANKKRVGIGAAVVAFVGLIAGLYAWHASERDAEAEEKLSSVHMPFSPLEQPAPGTAEALVKIAQDYPKTQAAAKALLRAGTIYFGEGNYAKARAQFDTYLREYGETPWISEAVFGIAACLDAEGKTTEAIAAYKDFVDKHSSDPAADQARFNLARLYEKSGQPALAMDTLMKMASPAQQGYNPAANEAQEKIRELYTKYPMLAAPQQPQTPPRPPTVTPSASAPQPNIVTPGGTSAPPKIILNPAQPSASPGK